MTFSCLHLVTDQRQREDVWWNQGDERDKGFKHAQGVLCLSFSYHGHWAECAAELHQLHWWPGRCISQNPRVWPLWPSVFCLQTPAVTQETCIINVSNSQFVNIFFLLSLKVTGSWKIEHFIYLFIIIGSLDAEIKISKWMFSRSVKPPLGAPVLCRQAARLWSRWCLEEGCHWRCTPDWWACGEPLNVQQAQWYGWMEELQRFRR